MARDLGTLLRPCPGWIVVAHGPDRNVEHGFGSIEVPFSPFALPADVAPAPDAVVETALRLDFITWPLGRGAGPPTLARLAGRSLDFAVNPDEGYIDGSIHLLGEHRPADVTRIVFGPVLEGPAVDAAITARIDAGGTGLRDFDGELRARLVERPSRPG